MAGFFAFFPDLLGDGPVHASPHRTFAPGIGGR